MTTEHTHASLVPGGTSALSAMDSTQIITLRVAQGR